MVVRIGWTEAIEQADALRPARLELAQDTVQDITFTPNRTVYQQGVTLRAGGVVATRGAVAASDPQTAEAGARALEAGGTAVDAVVAAAFASFVVEPPLTSPAGGGALLHGDTQRGWEVVDCMARTPGLGLDEWPELDFFGVEVDFGPTTQVFHIGRGAAATPGLLRGLLSVHAEHGRLPLAEVLAPAIRYARDGFVLGSAIHWVHSLLEPIVTLTEGIRGITCLDGALAPGGSELSNPDLGDFLAHLAEDPREALGRYHGALVEAFGPRHGGLLTLADLEAWVPERRKPLAVPWRDHIVLTNPPPSAGGGLIGFALRLLQHHPFERDVFHGPDHLAAVCDALGRVSALRASGYDNQLHDRAAIEALLSDESVARWAATIDPAREERQFGSTTHISVADGRGGAASLTTSNGEGSGTVLDGFGVHVNNFLGEEDINPGGFHAFSSGERMSTMMAPTIALHDGEPVLVLGSGGSNRIRSAVLQGLINRLGFGLDLDLACNAPRVHVEGSRLWFEGHDLPDETCARLLAEWPGATVFDGPNMFFGGVHAVARDAGGWTGAGDRRRGGVAR